MLSAFLVTYKDVFSGIHLKKYCGLLLLQILKNIPSFLYQYRHCSDSKPSSWESFSFDVPRMTPVMAKQVLY